MSIPLTTLKVDLLERDISFLELTIIFLILKRDTYRNFIFFYPKTSFIRLFASFLIGLDPSTKMLFMASSWSNFSGEQFDTEVPISVNLL